MRKRKLVVDESIVALGYDPSLKGFRWYWPNEDYLVEEGEIEEAIENALERLSDEERELLARYYFMGQTFTEMAELSGRALHKIRSMHVRAVKKLKKELAEFVYAWYGIEPDVHIDCPICTSEYCEEIEQLIQSKKKSEPWGVVMGELKERYRLTIKSPQLLIGHINYHYVERRK